MNDYGRRLAKVSLDIPSIKLSPDDPFTWASGYRMPIYNDNRKLLGDPAHRLLVTVGFESLIWDRGLEPEMISGTMTAGIAPAVSLAEQYGLPLLLQTPERSLLFTPELFERYKETDIGDAEAIASTCPYAIVPGVIAANAHQLPFMYVRQKKKGHGLKQQTEGLIVPGQRAFVIDRFVDPAEQYCDRAVAVLEERGVTVVGRDSRPLEREAYREGINPAFGKKVLKVEDLVSMGGSAAKEIAEEQKNGANVVACLSIFNYGLDTSAASFARVDTPLHSILDYDTLLEVAESTTPTMA